jgi:hypothetical protein
MHDGFRFTRSSRKHRIGRVHALHVMANTVPQHIDVPAGAPRLMWTGPDDRGVELDVIAVMLPGELLVIHVMPTHYRGRTP